MPTLMITGEARGMHQWIHETYGIGPQVKEWCQRLADRELPSTNGGFNFRKLWDSAAEIAKKPDEVHIARAVAEIGWDLYQKIRGQLSRRGEGTEVRVANETFGALSDGRFDVQVTALYEVNPKNETVAFLFFDTCTPARLESGRDPCEREPWK